MIRSVFSRLGGFTLALGLTTVPLTVVAEGTGPDADFPNKPIVLLSWSAAGSPVDVMAREIAKLAPKYLHQPMVVEDRTGGDGANAMQAVLSAPSDGYMLLANTRSLMATLNTDLKAKFAPSDFDFISTIETDPYAVAVPIDSPYKKFDDLLAAARTSAVVVGGYGADSAHALLGRSIAAKFGVKFAWVPFSGGSAAMTALLGSHIAAMIGNVSELKAQVEGGKVRVLALTTAKPIAAFKDAVPLAEHNPKFAISHWRGVMAKAGTPSAVEAKLDRFFQQVTQDSEFRAYVAAANLTPFYNGPGRVSDIVRSDMSVMARQLSEK